MTFYFKPPRGTITLSSLDQCITERIKYLKQIEPLRSLTDFEEPIEFQYLTEGSAFDRTGHYMLRLLSLRVERVYNFFLKYETILFEKRLNCLDPFHLRVELKTVTRHLEEIKKYIKELLPKYRVYIETLLYVCQELTQRKIAEHAFSTAHSDSCEEYFLDVPFTTCLPFILKRQVEIKNGIASIPCGKWRSFLVCLFEIHLHFGLDQLRASPICEEAFQDSRIQYITEACFGIFQSGNLQCCKGSENTLKSGDVDCQSAIFPPCMSSLHKTLRQRHRLSHDARFHYSLFLKDIGMPLEEATEFWKKEYLQPHIGCTACSHSWQKDGKRYLYSIRHLYGLEGARKTYRTPGCKRLQGLVLGSNAEGGCPFQHYDEDKLIQTFHDAIRKHSDTVASLIETNKSNGPQSACRKYHFLVRRLVHKDAAYEDGVSESYVKLEHNPVSFYCHQNTS